MLVISTRNCRNSERTLKGDNKEAAQARGWDDATLKGRFLKQKRNTAGVEKYDMDENEFNYSDGDGSESDESDLSEDALELYKEDANHSDDNDDGDFDKLLEQYSEHHLGYEVLFFSRILSPVNLIMIISTMLQEDEDITIEGAIDLAAGSNALLEAAMDEFLQVSYVIQVNCCLEFPQVAKFILYHILYCFFRNNWTAIATKGSKTKIMLKSRNRWKFFVLI